MLMDQIIQAKQGSQADMLSLLQQFQPILKKYGRKLWGEDGLEDMTAAFLQVIHDMKPEQIRCRAEGAVVQYLVRLCAMPMSGCSGSGCASLPLPFL